MLCKFKTTLLKTKHKHKHEQIYNWAKFMIDLVTDRLQKRDEIQKLKLQYIIPIKAVDLTCTFHRLKLRLIGKI